MNHVVRNRVLLAVLCLTLFATLGTASFAQSKAPPQPQWISIMVVHVKPEMLTEYLNFQKNEAVPTLQKGGVKERSVWQAAAFGEAFQYVFITPIDSLAQFDGDGPLQKALGKEGAEAYLAKARTFMSSVHTYGSLTRPDLSYVPEMMGTPKLAVVTTVNVAPGRRTEFEKLLKDEVVPVMKKAGVKGFYVSQGVFGGDGNTYVSLTLYDSFAEIGKGSPSMKVLGREGAAMLAQKFTGIMTHIETTIERYNADLSFRAMPQGK
jgi:heme-degrading monooxygenase HmoA